MIYLIILIYIIFLNIAYPKIDKNGIQSYWYLYVIFVILAGFRYKMGVDTYAYTLEYKTFPTLFQLNHNFIKESNYQILWILFESTLRTISSSFYVVQIVLAAFVNYVVFKVVKTHAVNPFLSILFYYLLFYINLNMEILRESVAISLLLLGINFLIKKQYLSYYGLAFIAFFFHQSAIVLFIVPLIQLVNFNKTGYFITIIVIISIAEFLSFYFVGYLSTFNYFFTFSQYGYFDALGTIGSSLNTQIFNYIKYIAIPCLLLFLFFDRLDEYERKYIFLYILFSIFYIQMAIFYRIRDYFLIFFLIAVTNGIIRGFDNKMHNLITKGAVISLFLYASLFRVYYSETNKNGLQLYLHYYPYNSILNEEVPQTRLDNFSKVGSIRK